MGQTRRKSFCGNIPEARVELARDIISADFEVAEGSILLSPAWPTQPYSVVPSSLHAPPRAACHHPSPYARYSARNVTSHG
jgi:hypothetical protein